MISNIFRNSLGNSIRANGFSYSCMLSEYGLRCVTCSTMNISKHCALRGLDYSSLSALR